MPFVTAVVAFFTSLGARASNGCCLASVFGGFVVGAFLGALSVAFANVVLSRAHRCTNRACAIGMAAIYFILPIVFMAVGCLAACYGLRIVL